MTVRLAFALAGALAVGGCNLSSDPMVFPYSKDQVAATLADSKTILARRDGPGEIKIWGAGRSAKGVKLNMTYASSAALLECEAIITSTTPKESRVAADCNRTLDNIHAPMFEEHIAATLNKRAFNRGNAEIKEAAAVLLSVGKMHRDALR